MEALHKNDTAPTRSVQGRPLLLRGWSAGQTPRPMNGRKVKKIKKVKKQNLRYGRNAEDASPSPSPPGR